MFQMTYIYVTYINVIYHLKVPRDIYIYIYRMGAVKGYQCYCYYNTMATRTRQWHARQVGKFQVKRTKWLLKVAKISNELCLLLFDLP